MQFPMHYTENQRALMLALVDQARNCNRPYDGPWTAPWLHSAINADKWELRTARTRTYRGDTRGLYGVNWKLILANGTYLTDPGNAQFLDTIRKASFLVRQLPSFGIKTNSSHLGWISQIQTFVEWLYLNDDIYHPATRQFTLVDEGAINAYVGQAIRGGKAGLLQLPERVLQYFYEHALGSTCPQSVLDTPWAVAEKPRRMINAWLESQGMYSTSRIGGKSVRYLNRVRLGAAIGADLRRITDDQFAGFLRQFEPTLLAINDHLLLPATGSRNEYPSHRTPLIREVQDQPYTYTSISPITEVLLQVFRLRRHLPEAIPPDTQLNLARAREMIKQHTKRPDKTPWIPLPIALKLTNESLRWVHQYGDELVKLYISGAKHFTRSGWLNDDGLGSSPRTRRRRLRNAWVQEHVTSKLRTLGIEKWSYDTQDLSGSPQRYENLRSNPSLMDALYVWAGAVTLLIGVLMPCRASELALLERDCLKFKKGDGYWLRRPLRKVTANDHTAEADRPIPTIVARAVQQLRQLGTALAQLSETDDPIALKQLFYLPNYGASGRCKASTDMIESYLDRFTDYVNIPPDNEGRRWYVRDHELRKSFLITFFWCFRYSSLDAASWMAGHRNSRDIYRYIEANFPGDELPQIEAEYASAVLRDAEESRSRPHNKSVDALHSAVCRHFGVSKLSLVGEDQLELWLTEAFRKGIYQIRPFEIRSADGSSSTTVAFVIHKQSRGKP